MDAAMRTFDEIAADARPGRAFSNNTSFEVWAGSPGGCYLCVNDGMGVGKEEPACPIFGVALVNGTTPAEWQERTPESIQDYVCSSYEERPDDDDGGGPDAGPPDPDPPVVEMEGQLDIFSVWADAIADAPTKSLQEARS